MRLDFRDAGEIGRRIGLGTKFQIIRSGDKVAGKAIWCPFGSTSWVHFSSLQDSICAI